LHFAEKKNECKDKNIKDSKKKKKKKKKNIKIKKKKKKKESKCISSFLQQY